jgi:hypothetical protein
MERRIRILGLCVIAGFLLSMVAGATAQASTEILACVKAQKSNKGFSGRYEDKQCTVEAPGGTGGKYELDVGGKWVGRGKKKVKLVSAGAEIVCATSRGSGTLLGPTRLQGTLLLLKCAEGKSACTTQGHKAGEIETNVLLGALEEGAGREVLVSFTGREAGSTEPAPMERFAEFECGGTRFDLHGTVSGKWAGAVNELVKNGDGGIEFALGSGEQELIEQFVNPISEEPEEVTATLEGSQAWKMPKYEIRQE